MRREKAIREKHKFVEVKQPPDLKETLAFDADKKKKMKHGVETNDTLVKTTSPNDEISPKSEELPAQEEAIQSHVAENLENQEKPLAPVVLAYIPDPDYYPGYARLMWTVILFPIIAFEFVFVQLFLLSLFYMKIQLIYNWGGCKDDNAKAKAECKCCF